MALSLWNQGDTKFAFGSLPQYRPEVNGCADLKPPGKRKRVLSSEAMEPRAEYAIITAAAHTQANTPSNTWKQPFNNHLPLPTPVHSPTSPVMNSGKFQVSSQSANADHCDRTEGRLDRIRQITSQQIDLEIMLKHQELRLIDQEIAKCQTGYEQIRRCYELPFPATIMDSGVPRGRGPVSRSSYTGKVPQSPAPWGVTDGPYTRHYAQWLLPDSHFDGGEQAPVVLASGKRPTKYRIARQSHSIDEPQLGMSSRSQRAGNHKALPAGYGQVKEKASGPLLLKRKSDGVMVKLICPTCSRGDFGSAQGFINHCRIGHGRNFSSHDQAAEQCGEPVEIDQQGAVVGQELAATSTSSFIHPLIRTARLNQPSGSIPQRPQAVVSDELTSTLAKLKPSVSPDFRESTQTPHLSDLVRIKGLGLDLQGMVSDTTMKVEESDSESDGEEMEGSELSSASKGHPFIGGTRGVSKTAKMPATSPALHTQRLTTNAEDVEMADTELQSTTNISDGAAEPSPNTDSNQAPSLIDDDEEYEVHTPVSNTGSDVADEGEIDFAVRDDDDAHSHEVLQQEAQPTCASVDDSSSPRPARVRRPSQFRSENGAPHPRQVTFVNENPATLIAGGEKKRRKIGKS